MRGPMPGQELDAREVREPSILENATCPYCGADLATAEWDKEHVIARRLVPRGKLDGGWNLILRACKPCNARKAQLEDELSALSMQAPLGDRHAHDDAALAAEALRKADGSISSRTGKRVAESREELIIEGNLSPGIKAKFQLLSGPQIDEKRAFELAWFQVRALFYFVTFNLESRRGGYWIGTFLPVQCVSRPDWGNRWKRGFMKAVIPWKTLFYCVTAKGFFKAVIRRRGDSKVWSWAIEWNHNVRILGFFGEKEMALAAADGLPKLTVSEMPVEGGHVRMRKEEALEEEDDILFDFGQPC